jgi:hypothetical protein
MSLESQWFHSNRWRLLSIPMWNWLQPRLLLSHPMANIIHLTFPSRRSIIRTLIVVAAYQIVRLIAMLTYFWAKIFLRHKATTMIWVCSILLTHLKDLILALISALFPRIVTILLVTHSNKNLLKFKVIGRRVILEMKWIKVGTIHW